MCLKNYSRYFVTSRKTRIERQAVGKMFVLLGLMIVAVFVFKELTAKKGSKKNWPVKARKPMNETEAAAYERISEALSDRTVLAQVSMSQIVSVRSGKEHAWAWNKISQKVCDYVVLRKDLSVQAVIELDGQSHDKPARMKSDRDKEAALSAAGIKLVRVNSKQIPNGAQLRELVN